MHFLVGAENFNLVLKFDVDALANQLEEVLLQFEPLKSDIYCFMIE